MNAILVPPFGPEGGLTLVLVRGIFVAAQLAAFGTVLFMLLVAPRALSRSAPGDVLAAERRLVRLARAEVMAALLALAAWLAAQAVDLADAARVRDAIAAIPAVLVATAFGHLVLAQASALLASWIALRWRFAPPMVSKRVAAALLGLATILQAGHGHAWAMYSGPSLLLLACIVHLLAAGGWLGGLVPLLLLVREMPPKVGAAAARWFSPLGKWCVAGVVASAAVQFWHLIGGLPGLVGTSYGWVAGLKLVLLGVLFGFALLNRYQLAPALLQASAARARRRLLVSVAVQSGFGLLTVLAAGLLSNLPPAMHVQPLWPFPWRLSMEAVQEDADFRRDVLLALAALVSSLALLGVAIIARRWQRWLLAATAVAVAWLALPHLGLLLADAYPTYYWHSPTNFASASIVQGAALFQQNCISCHGSEGRGDGPAAKNLPVPPADLTAAHLWMHSDGELFWWLTHGIEAPEGGLGGGLAMPGFAGVLSEDERWALIDWTHAHNAGLARAATGTWPRPVEAPGLEAHCADGRDLTLRDLRGQIVRLVFGPAPPEPGVLTIAVTLSAVPHESLCVADDEMIHQAYAIVSGLSPQLLSGAQILIDGDGWLRAVRLSGAGPDWNDPAALAAAVRDIKQHPFAASQARFMPMNMQM